MENHQKRDYIEERANKLILLFNQYRRHARKGEWSYAAEVVEDIRDVEIELKDMLKIEF